MSLNDKYRNVEVILEIKNLLVENLNIVMKEKKFY